jgi:hypothetical protein
MEKEEVVKRCLEEALGPTWKGQIPRLTLDKFAGSVGEISQRRKELLGSSGFGERRWEIISPYSFDPPWKITKAYEEFARPKFFVAYDHYRWPRGTHTLSTAGCWRLYSSPLNTKGLERTMGFVVPLDMEFNFLRLDTIIDSLLTMGPQKPMLRQVGERHFPKPPYSIANLQEVITKNLSIHTLALDRAVESTKISYEDLLDLAERSASPPPVLKSIANYLPPIKQEFYVFSRAVYPMEALRKESRKSIRKDSHYDLYDLTPSLSQPIEVEPLITSYDPIVALPVPDFLGFIPEEGTSSLPEVWRIKVPKNFRGGLFIENISSSNMNDPSVLKPASPYVVLRGTLTRTKIMGVNLMIPYIDPQESPERRKKLAEKYVVVHDFALSSD